MKRTTPRQIRKRTFIILGAGLLIALLGIAMNEVTPVIMIGLLIMFSSIIHHAIFYRCPHCGKFLDRSTGEFCPGCGKKVNAGAVICPAIITAIAFKNLAGRAY